MKAQEINESKMFALWIIAILLLCNLIALVFVVDNIAKKGNKIASAIEKQDLSVNLETKKVSKAINESTQMQKEMFELYLASQNSDYTQGMINIQEAKAEILASQNPVAIFDNWTAHQSMSNANKVLNLALNRLLYVWQKIDKKEKTSIFQKAAKLAEFDLKRKQKIKLFFKKISDQYPEDIYDNFKLTFIYLNKSELIKLKPFFEKQISNNPHDFLEYYWPNIKNMPEFKDLFVPAVRKSVDGWSSFLSDNQLQRLVIEIKKHPQAENIFLGISNDLKKLDPDGLGWLFVYNFYKHERVYKIMDEPYGRKFYENLKKNAPEDLKDNIDEILNQ